MVPRKLLRYGLVLISFLCLYLLMTWISSVKEIVPNGDVNFARITQQDWQPVTGSKFKFAIYSAYSLVDRNPSEVLIIGITKKFLKEKIHCKFYFREDDHDQDNVGAVEWADKTVPGTIETLIPGSGGFLAGVFIKCPLPFKPNGESNNNTNTRPEMVSILLNTQTKASNMLPIQYGNESKDAPYQYKFSVCVKPTFSFNQVLPLLEWLEFYRLMGVEQFTLFNMSIGPEASCILNSYGHENSIKINVLPWHNHHLLNAKENAGNGNVPQYSIAAAQNDCVHRHRGHHSKYMIYVDFDEFIMPREGKAKNFQDLIQLLDSQNKRMTIGEYQFKNAFFILSRPDDYLLLERCSTYPKGSLEHRICMGSLLLRKSIREEYYPFRKRTKYIIKPEGVLQTSNHFVHRFEDGYESLHVPESIAFSRHYRNFNEGNNSVNDAVPNQLGLKLVENLAKRVEVLQKLCNFNLDDN